MIYIFLSTFTHLSFNLLNNSAIYRNFTYTNVELIVYAIHVYTEVRGVHQTPCAILWPIPLLRWL